MSTAELVTTPGFELVTSDGEPLDDNWDGLQMELLRNSTHRRFADRTDYFTGVNMFVYYSFEQARGVAEEVAEEERARSEGRPPPPKKHFRGPDYFCVLGVDLDRKRQVWVAWEEDGRYPDVIVELLSRSTRKMDLGVKKDLYEGTFHTLEYFCYDPEAEQLHGWRLVEGKYRPIQPDAQGRMSSQVLGVRLGLWRGSFSRQTDTWLRFYDEMGNLVENDEERAEFERGRAEFERGRAEFERGRAESERARAERAEAELERLRKFMQEQQGG